ncbi:family 16 glycoside hydrolase [Parabacteroides sp.]
MRKAYISIASLLLFGSVLMAQSPANRTAKTTVADVLAQMPAEQQAEYNKLINDLKGTGEEGVLMLVNRINAPGKGSNAQVDYALSGLTHFVAAKGEESARLVIANAYIKALEMVNERETKAFIIRQLQLLGGDESVDALAAYLGDESLSGPASRALAAIGTENAGKALKAGLMRRMGTPKTQKDIIVAIGEAQVEGSEELLKALLGSADEDMQKTVLYALSRVGTKASIKELSEAAAATGYTMAKNNANEAYIALLQRVAAQGDVKEVEKAANDLMKKATKAGKTQTRDAALQILFSLNKDNTKLLLAALKDTDKAYRNTALNYASDFAGKETYIEVMKAMQKAKPEVKVDIVNWIGREAKCPSKHDIIKNLELRFDLPAMQVLLAQMKDPDFDVKQATVWTLVKIGDKQSIAPLAELLSSDEKKVILLGQDALAAFKGDIDQAVARVIPSATDAGKIAAVELLAMRKATANLNSVLELIKSGSPEVKKAAYLALKDVVSEGDLVTLCGMLETADASAVASLQQAVISAISSMSPANRMETITRRMIQAGENKKHLYYVVLATTGEPDALATIVDGFRTGKGEARDAAFDALLHWKGIEAADELFAICQDAASSAYFDRALNAYVALVANPAFTGENRLLGLRKAMEIAKTDAEKIEILKQIEKTGTFLGMLYAGEFLDQKPVQQAAANAVMNIALGNKEYWGTNVRELLNKVMQVLDNPDAGYQKEAIKKHLAEMPQGEGFVSIFNGKDLTGWKGLVENPIVRAKMKPAQLEKAQAKADENMRRDWKVENGLLMFDGSGYDNLCTEKQYGDFEMYVDWMLDPAGPEADAGIYLRGTPQVQIWDTSRVNVGAQVGSGGLYNNQVNESKPSKVADNKLGEWNSFYIKMVGDRVTVILNGEKVVDDVILENYWDRKQPIFPIEQIELQAHGSKVYYRNIYVKELERKEPFKLSAEEQKEGFKVLFDGTNMHQWTGNTVDYTLEDGCIAMNPSKSFGGNLYTKDEYGNFIYRFEFQLTPGANNGVGIRTPMEGDAAYVGMEIQILDCEHPIYKDITKYQHHGSVYGIIPANEDHHKAFKPVGEWNEEEIVANGDHIKVTVNGVVILDGNIRDAVKNGTPDGQEHPGLFNKKGHIGFLGHGSPVKFRNIRIKELK